jgi:hypothetical protein
MIKKINSSSNTTINIKKDLKVPKLNIEVSKQFYFPKSKEDSKIVTRVETRLPTQTLNNTSSQASFRKGFINYKRNDLLTDYEKLISNSKS